VGYGSCQRIRMRIETIFGWLKSVGGLRRTRYRGRRKTQFAAYLAGAYSESKLATTERTQSAEVASFGEDDEALAAVYLMRVSRLRTCAV